MSAAGSFRSPARNQIDCSLAGIRKLLSRFNVPTWGLVLFLVGFVAAWETRLHRDILYFLLFLPVIVLMTKRDWRVLLGNHLIIGVFSFLSYLLLTMLWASSVDLSEAVERIRHAVITLGFVLAVAWVVANDPIWWQRFLWVAVPAAAAIFLISFWPYYTSGAVFSDRLVNVVFYHSNPNPAAVGFLPVFLISCYALSSGCKRPIVLMAFIGLSASAAFLVLAQSRALLLAGFIGLLAMLVVRQRWWALVAAMLTAALVLGFWEVSDWTGRGLIERADSNRLGIWEGAVRLIGQSPFLGYGFGSEVPIETDSGREYLSPHNIWLMAGITGGVIGIVMLALVYFLGLRSAGRSVGDGVSGYVLVISLVLAGFVVINLDSHEIIRRVNPHLWIGLWFPLGLLVGLNIRRCAHDQGRICHTGA